MANVFEKKGAQTVRSVLSETWFCCLSDFNLEMDAGLHSWGGGVHPTGAVSVPKKVHCSREGVLYFKSTFYCLCDFICMAVQRTVGSGSGEVCLHIITSLFFFSFYLSSLRSVSVVVFLHYSVINIFFGYT